MICTVLEAGDHVEALASDAARRRLASCGRPSLVADIAILAESGELAGVDEPGEILVRGDLVMRGYFDNAEATEATRHGEWHRTGDIGVVDADGFVYIVDRVKDMIISGGYNVYPSEIERVVWTHPGVADCAVIGIPHDEWGEQVTAVVEPKDGVAVDPAEIIAVCRAKLGSIKAPKQVIVRELPRSPVGKVLKRALRDEYWAGRERKI